MVTTLRRHQRMPEEEKRERIAQSAVSSGEIFDAFNYFYFGYVSCDWAEILMECYETVEEIPAAAKKRLANVLRKGKPMLRLASDDAVIRRAMQAYEDDETDGQTGRSRVGELTVYKYIQGTLDVDRTALICFLLFFASDAAMPDEHKLTVERLEQILVNCGYTPLDTENDFDWFAAEFLESRRPRDLLTQVVAECARRGENSFLYHLYGSSVNYESELLRVMTKHA